MTTATTAANGDTLPAMPTAGPTAGRKRLRRVATVLVIGIGIAMAWVWWRFLAVTEPQTFEVVHRAGTTTIEADASTPRPGAAEGTSIRTGTDGFVTLRLDDGSTIQVMPDTRVRLERARRDEEGSRFETQFRLDAGEITSRVETGDRRRRAVTLVTDAVNIGVRGTLFTVRHEPGQSLLTVSEGRVRAEGTEGTAVDVGSDLGTAIRAGVAPLEPVPLPPPPRPLSPVAGAPTGVAPLRFAWDPVGGIEQVEIQIATDESFQRMVARATAAGTETTIAPLAADGPYYWRVASVDRLGLRGRWTAPVRFVQDHFREEGRRALFGQDPSRALALFRNSEADVSEEIDALRRQGLAMLAAGDIEAARGRLATVLEVRPDDVAARNGVAMSLLGAAEYEGARREFGRVLEHAPKDPNANVGLAFLDFRSARYDAAFERARKALEGDATNVQALELAAITAVNTGRTDEARTHLARLVEIEPGNETARILSATLDVPPVDPQALQGVDPTDPRKEPGG